MKSFGLRTIASTLLLAALPAALCSCQRNRKKAAIVDCIPADVPRDEFVTRQAGRVINVEQKLKMMEAYCDQGKLLTRAGREIRFFRPYCGGAAPPPDLMLRKRQELEELQKHYEVIVLECDFDMRALPQ